MPFKSDKQRRGFFAQRNNPSSSNNPIIIKTNVNTNAEKRGVFVERRGKELVFSTALRRRDDLAFKIKGVNPKIASLLVFENKKGTLFRSTAAGGKIVEIRKKDRILKVVNGKFIKASDFKETGGTRLSAFQRRIKDIDGDGVPNTKDCKPFDPKRQGKLHDLAINVLRKKEEFVEKRREKQMSKLEDLKDRLQQRKAVLSERNAVMAEKQAVIDEAQKERQQIRDLKTANREAKKELFRTSKLGRTIKGTARAGQATIRGTKATVEAVKRSAEALKKTQKTLKKLFG